MQTLLTGALDILQLCRCNTICGRPIPKRTLDAASSDVPWVDHPFHARLPRSSVHGLEVVGLDGCLPVPHSSSFLGSDDSPRCTPSHLLDHLFSFDGRDIALL